MLQTFLSGLTHVVLAQADQPPQFPLTPTAQAWLAACTVVMLGAGVLVEKIIKLWTAWRDSKRADRIADASLEGTWFREYELLDHKYKELLKESAADYSQLAKRLEESEARRREVERQKDEMAIRLAQLGIGHGSSSWESRNPKVDPKSRPPAP